MKFLYGLLVLLALAGAAEWHGHHRGYDSGVQATQKDAQKKVDKANGDRDVAIADREAAEQTLATVQRKLKVQGDALDLANFFAQAALDERDGLQHKLDAANAARDTALRKAAHDSPDCADLAHLPVCPAVADRLWPKAAGDPADARH